MIASDPVILQTIIDEKYQSLAAKGKLLASFVMSNPDKAVFMTTRQLAAASGTSEATVIRFVRQLGFKSYALFIAALRDLIDRELTLLERRKLKRTVKGSDEEELNRLVEQDIGNIITMQKEMDLKRAKKVREVLKAASEIYVIGARLSYSPAHYLGWTLSKIRSNVTILNGSDKTSIDRMVFAKEDTAVVIVATSRYPNELIRMGKIFRRRNFVQILITDSKACPLAPFSDHILVAPQTSIPYLGNPVSIISMIHYLLHSLTGEMGEELRRHQEKLEQAYMENDIWFI